MASTRRIFQCSQAAGETLLVLQARARPTVAPADAPAVLRPPTSSFAARLRSSRLGRVFGASAGAIRSAGQVNPPP